jgi:hypothetical protein
LKLRFHLIPMDALRAVATVFTAAAKKHGDTAYEQGRPWSIEYDAAMRHLTAWWLRAPPDRLARLSHLCNAGARILILIAYELRGIGTDDRPKKGRVKR